MWAFARNYIIGYNYIFDYFLTKLTLPIDNPALEIKIIL